MVIIAKLCPRELDDVGSRYYFMCFTRYILFRRYDHTCENRKVRPQADAPHDILVGQNHIEHVNKKS